MIKRRKQEDAVTGLGDALTVKPGEIVTYHNEQWALSQAKTVVAGAESDRDSWTTPKWLTDLLPIVDLDPCSNERSTVRHSISYRLSNEADNGLTKDWHGLVFVNPPYSAILPWAQKLAAEYRHIRGVGFLVNADSSTAWWRILRRYLPIRLDFDKRIQFEPPPGVAVSSNSKPQTLLMTESFLVECDERLMQHGTLWRRL